MKKLLLIAVLSVFVMSCGTAATNSGFWQHDSVYKSWDHLRFSWWGHNSPTDEDVKKSVEEGWWGSDVPYIPGQ